MDFERNQRIKKPALEGIKAGKGDKHMSSNHNEQCRVSLDELDHAHRMDVEQGLCDTPEQMVKDRVIELMSEDSGDEDSIVVLMESDRFVNALRQLFAHRHTDKRCHEELLESSVNLVSVAETVLSEYVELGL